MAAMRVMANVLPGSATLLMAEASSGQAKAPGVVSECDGQLGDGDATFLAVAASEQAKATGVDGCVADARMDLDPNELMVTCSPRKSRLVLLHATARTARMLRRFGRSHWRGSARTCRHGRTSLSPTRRSLRASGTPS